MMFPFKTSAFVWHLDWGKEQFCAVFMLELLTHSDHRVQTDREDIVQSVTVSFVKMVDEAKVKYICDIYDWDGKGEIDLFFLGDVMYALGLNITKKVSGQSEQSIQALSQSELRSQALNQSKLSIQALSQSELSIQAVNQSEISI